MRNDVLQTGAQFLLQSVYLKCVYNQLAPAICLSGTWNILGSVYTTKQKVAFPLFYLAKF